MQDITTFIANHPGLSVAALILLVLVFFIELARGNRTRNSVSPREATQLINHQRAVVIDTRPADIFKKGHIIDAESIPSEQITENGKKLEKFKSKPIIVVCQTGVESQKIAALLTKQGYNAISLAGGMRAWTLAEMPVIKD